MQRLLILSFIFLFILNYGVSQDFLHDFDTAIQKSKDENKTMMMVFSGSDWCKPCIQLKKTILSSETFTAYSQDKLILLELDFPYKKKNQLDKEQLKHNEALADKYNKEGAFPKLILLNSEKQVIGQAEYRKNMTADQMIQQIDPLLQKG